MGARSLGPENNKEQFEHQVNRLGYNFSSQLNDQSLQFLQSLWAHAPFPFDQLLTKLERHPFTLKVHHIETVVTLITNQIALPENILISLKAHLECCPDFESTIDKLLTAHAPELLASAAQHNLIHHSLPHALETANRVNKVLDNLGILTNGDDTSRFLRAIINVMIQFHDHEQKIKGEYNSVEVATAARVSQWLSNALAISDESSLKLLLNFVANHIIVLGTSIVYSPTRTMDLSELFIEFKDVAVAASLKVAYQSQELPVVLESKAGLVYCMDAIMLIVGICDKNPAAIYDLVAMQEANAATATLPMIKSYTQTPLLLEQFFASGAFRRSFNNGSSDAINQQAFLMSLTPHLCMRAELSGANQRADAHTFMKLIALCRQERLNNLDHVAFMQWFNNQCLTHEMNRVVLSFFFADIEREIAFCKSQELSLVFVANKLMSMRFSPKSLAGAASGRFQPLINPQVPVEDAENLRALKQFYDRLDKSGQETLIGELLFVVVVQAGEMDAEQLGLAHLEYATPYCVQRDSCREHVRTMYELSIS